MSDALRIAPMTPDHLRIAVDWAAAEGWNPGLDDVEAFHRVDPDGFLMGWFGDSPVSAISVVRHSDEFGFLGFYLCHPSHRGKGYGVAIWQVGMAHLGTRTVGLDGVPAQQANYRKSGFAHAHETVRHAGDVTGKAHPDVRDAQVSDLQGMLAVDRAISATDRSAYLLAWWEQTPTRRTMIRAGGDGIDTIGTIRACREGHKIGPLFAPDADRARDMIHALADAADARHVMLDVPAPNVAGTALARALGLEPIFACARMYRGDALTRDIDRIFGETTFELG